MLKGHTGTPATSLANRMHRVQWMHRVMIVFTSGPMSLSSTALFKNTANLLSVKNKLRHALKFKKK